MFNSKIKSTRNKSIFKLNPPISIKTNKVKLLYPLQQNFNNIILKTEFLETNDPIYTKIKELEQYYFDKFKQYLDDNYYNKEVTLQSQINQIKQFKPYLISKVFKKGNKIITKVSKDSNEINLFDLQKDNIFTMEIVIDNFWISNNNEVVIKWKISNIYV